MKTIPLSLFAIRMAVFAAAIFCSVGRLSAGTVDELNLVCDTNISVNAGETLDVTLLSGGAYTLTKSGGGTLRLAQITDSRAKLVVDAGALAFAPLAYDAAAASNVMKKAAYYVDPSAPSTVTLSPAGGTNFVTRWNDANGNDIYAVPIHQVPFQQTNFQNNLPVMDFGSYWYKRGDNGYLYASGYGAGLQWSRTLARITDVFSVFCDTEDIEDTVEQEPYLQGLASFILGCSTNWDFHRGYHRDLTIGWGSQAVWGGAFEVDGEPRPYNYSLPSGFHLIHMATDLTLNNGLARANQFAGDRSLSFGGQRLGEVLIFTNTLDTAERVALTRRLMSRWGLRQTISSLTLNTGTQLVLGTNTQVQVSLLTVNGQAAFSGGKLFVEQVLSGKGNLTVAAGTMTQISTSTNCIASLLPSSDNTVDCNGRFRACTLDGNGVLTKTGKGTLEFASLGSGVTGLSVQKGSVKLSPLLNKDAFFHVDASEPFSMTASVQNGTNFVSHWADVNSNGMYAIAEHAKPFLQTNFQNNLPVMDFGTYWYTTRVSGYGATFRWCTTNSAIREVLLVVSDTEDILTIVEPHSYLQGLAQFMLGDSNGTFYFHRGYHRAMFHPDWSSSLIRNGVITLDGSQVPSSTVLPEGFHLVGIQTLGNVIAGRFAGDRTMTGGGQRLGEVLVFTNLLSTVDRGRIQDALREKWFGTAPALDYPYSLPGISLARGTSFAIPYASAVVGTLSGCGAVSADRLTVTNLLPSASMVVTGDVTLPDSGIVQTGGNAASGFTMVTVSGKLTFAGGGTVRLSCGGNVAGLSKHSFKLFDCGSVAGDPGKWKVRGDFTSACTAKLTVVGNAVYASFTSNGTVVMLK